MTLISRGTLDYRGVATVEAGTLAAHGRHIATRDLQVHAARWERRDERARAGLAVERQVLIGEARSGGLTEGEIDAILVARR